MKKVKSLIAMVFLLSMFFQMTSAQTLDEKNVYASTIDQLTSDSKSLKKQSIDDDKYLDDIAQMNITYEEGQLYIRGTVASSGKRFAIQGEAQNSGSNDMILFNGVDKNQNFEVVHMAYSNLVKNTSLYHDTLKRTMPNASVLKIYLKEPNKNALTMIEVINPSELRGSNIMAERSTFSKNEEAGFWYAKLFVPEVSDARNTVSGKDYNDGTYSYVFEHLGGKVYHYMTLRREVTVPSYLNGQSDFGTVLEVVRKWSTSSDFADQNTEGSCLSVRDVKIEVATGSYDYIESYQITGTVHTTWSVDVSLDFDTSISIYGPVSLGLSYTKSDPNAKISLDFFDLSGMPRAALSSLESDKRLEAKGHKYSTWWRIAKQDSTRRTNSFQVRFYYDISSLYDYTWGGPKTFTKSYSYVSNN